MIKTISPSVSYFEFYPLCWFYEESSTNVRREQFKYYYSNGITNTKTAITVDGIVVFDTGEIEDAGEFEVDLSSNCDSASGKKNDNLIKKSLSKRSAIINCFRSIMLSNILIKQEIALNVLPPITMSTIKSCANIREPLDLSISEGKRKALIEKETITDAIQKFDRIVVNNTYLELCNLIYKSHWEFSQANYSSALIESWTVIEKLVNIKWEQYVNESSAKGIRINSDRKNGLLKSPNFSTSVVTEILSLAGKLEETEYTNICKIRSIRNNWMHYMRLVNESDAVVALKLVDELYSNYVQFEFRLPISLSVSLVTETTAKFENNLNSEVAE